MEFETECDDYDYYVEFDNFYIGNETELYRMKSLGRTLHDSLAGGWLPGNDTFRTWDRDNDRKYGLKYNGFWYSDRYRAQPFNGKVGKYLSCPISWMELKIRPVQK